MSAVNAPYHRILGRSSNIGASGIPYDAAPSLDFLGCGVQDHRLAYNSRGSSASQPALVGWYGAGSVMVIDFVPSAAAVANIAAAANVVNGTAMTLVNASGAGIVALSASSPAVFQPSGQSVSAGVAIENLPGMVSFGTAGNFTTSFYDRSKTVGRAVSITGSASATGGAFLVKGFDVYGYAMSEQITVGAGAVTQNGKKAFKVVTSVTPQFTDAHNYSVGTADIFGLGLLAGNFGMVDITWNNTKVTANTGFTAADTTAPATTTTGDVRGTYAVQSASDGSKRLTIYVSPSLSAIGSNVTTGLFGQPQV